MTAAVDVRSTLPAVLQDVALRVDRDSIQCRRSWKADSDYRRAPAAATVRR